MVAGLEQEFTSALEKAGLSDRKLRFHDCRVTFAVHLAEFVPELACAQLLGHSKSTVTRGYGQRLPLEKLRRGLDQVPWLFPERQKSLVHRVDG